MDTNCLELTKVKPTASKDLEALCLDMQSVDNVNFIVRCSRRLASFRSPWRDWKQPHNTVVSLKDLRQLAHMLYSSMSNP